jgi:hypothetical protein
VNKQLNDKERVADALENAAIQPHCEQLLDKTGYQFECSSSARRIISAFLSGNYCSLMQLEI